MQKMIAIDRFRSDMQEDIPICAGGSLETVQRHDEKTAIALSSSQALPTSIFSSIYSSIKSSVSVPTNSAESSCDSEDLLFFPIMESGWHPSLDFAGDCTSMAELFKDYGGFKPTSYIKSVAAVSRAICLKLETATNASKWIFYLAGHGSEDSDGTNVELQGTWLSALKILQLCASSDGIHPLVIIILDCCRGAIRDHAPFDYATNEAVPENLSFMICYTASYGCNAYSENSRSAFCSRVMTWMKTETNASLSLLFGFDFPTSSALEQIAS